MNIYHYGILHQGVDMKVCHVGLGHFVDDSRIFHKECLSLARAGYQVSLIASGRNSQETLTEGIEIFPLPPCDSRWQRIRRRGQVADVARDIGADLYHVHEPVLLGSVLARVKGVPVIFDSHEHQVDCLRESDWIPSIMRPLAAHTWDRIERHLVSRCAAVLVPTEHVADRFRKLNSRVVLVRNFTDLDPDAFLSNRTGRDGRTVVFAGALTPNRNINRIVLALGLLRHHGITIRLLLAGGWLSKGYQNEILRLAIDQGVSAQVNYVGLLSRANAVSLQAQASIGIVVHDVRGALGLPIKLFELMALGLPVIYSDVPQLNRLVGSAGIGVPVDHTKPQDIARAIEYLVVNPKIAESMGDAGRSSIRNLFNWSSEEKKLLQLYREILS